ncbi:MAG: RNA methyltransferase [Candidatus Dormibacteraeota bacterium]|nr:RNA methyltransferase [Candidatus Dormibacteraeota bacterium]
MPSRASRAALAAPEAVLSPENRAVKRLRQLAKRREPGLALIEGPQVVAEAAARGVRLELLALRKGSESSIPAERVIELAPRLFSAVSQTVSPQGVLAIGKVTELSVSEALAAARAAGWPLLVLDGVQDPGNVGTICRSAVAAGAPAVALLGGADPFSAKAVRASAGTVFGLGVARGTWADLAGVRGLGATPRGGADIRRLDLKGVEVLALGSESHGLSNPRLEPVTIPMQRGAESLNVAAAAAVLLFELHRRLS